MFGANYDPASGQSFRFRLSDDLNGVRETMNLMKKIARISSRSAPFIMLADEIVRDRGIQEKNWFGEVSALHGFVRDRIRYTLDPVDLELIATPEMTLQRLEGDCDDKSTLLAALLEAKGHPARFCAVGFEPGNLSHVYVETRAGGFGNWIPLETTEPVAAGELAFSPSAVRESWRVHL